MYYSFVAVGAKVTLIDPKAARVEHDPAMTKGTILTVVSLAGASLEEGSGCYIVVEGPDGRERAVYLSGIGPKASDLQEMEGNVRQLEATLARVKREINFLKENKLAKFDSKLFAAWEQVRILKDAKLSAMEKAEQLAALDQ